jgi:hypothetical protein
MDCLLPTLQLSRPNYYFFTGRTWLVLSVPFKYWTAYIYVILCQFCKYVLPWNFINLKINSFHK